MKINEAIRIRIVGNIVAELRRLNYLKNTRKPEHSRELICAKIKTAQLCLSMVDRECAAFSEVIQEAEKEAAESFPYEYASTGYYREKGVPKGTVAKLLHGEQVIPAVISHFNKSLYL